jgi:predicted phosphohydrolase
MIRRGWRPVDAWLLGGDIGDARSVVPFLRQFHDQVPVPIYFVLGNHDFYYSSIAVVREQVGECVRYCSRLAWLTGSGAQFLSPTLALVGDDSWADARFGDAERS